MAEFEPKIVAFLCNFCSYAAADLAGMSRMHYPSNIRVVRLMCTGMLDPVYILEAFNHGADGVLVSGCHLGECHFISGNYEAKKRILLLKRVFEQFGIEPQRIRFEQISAGEAEKFVSVVTEMVDEVRRIGPIKAKS